MNKTEPHKTSVGDGFFKQKPQDWLCDTEAGAARSEGSAIHAVTSAGATFQWPLRVYWEDTDAGGIVFYANYLKFFERARTEWLRSLGIEQQLLRQTTGAMFVVAETTVRYLRPARLDDELVVTARLVQSGRASMTIEQAALLNHQTLCAGTIRIGWVDAATLQPARIPDNIIESLKVPT